MQPGLRFRKAFAAPAAEGKDWGNKNTKQFSESVHCSINYFISYSDPSRPTGMQGTDPWVNIIDH
jgi:hypothetical protein